MLNNILVYSKICFINLGFLALLLILGCKDNIAIKSKILGETKDLTNNTSERLLDAVYKGNTINSNRLSQGCVSKYNDPLVNGFTNFKYSLYDSFNLGNGFVSCLLRVDDINNSQHMKSGLFLNMDGVPSNELCFLEQLDSSAVIHVFSMRHEVIIQINRGFIYQADIINYDGQNKTTFFNPCIPITKINH